MLARATRPTGVPGGASGCWRLAQGVLWFLQGVLWLAQGVLWFLQGALAARSRGRPGLSDSDLDRPRSRGRPGHQTVTATRGLGLAAAPARAGDPAPRAPETPARGAGLHLSSLSHAPRGPRRRRDRVSRNLGEEGLPSADRNNKATLLLTGPFRATKSSAKDSSPRASKLQSANHRRPLRGRRDVRLLRH